MQYAPLVGRILFAAIFILTGFSHFGDAGNMVGMVPSFLPAPTFFVYLTGAMLLVGGLSVLAGFKAKMGGLILAAFLIPTALLVHAPNAGADQIAMMMMMKDLSMGGAALLIAYFGAGPMSMDAKGSAD